MSKKKNAKNSIIVILCITIIAMGIGFMVLSMRLESYRSEEEVFDVRFTSVRMLSSIKGGEQNPVGQLEIDSTGKILQLDFRLYKEHDEVDYEATIKNEGTVEASIVSLFSSPDFRSQEVIQTYFPVVISVSDLSGKLLEPGEETTVKISAIYNSLDSKQKKDKTIELSGKIGIIAESNISTDFLANLIQSLSHDFEVFLCCPGSSKSFSGRPIRNVVQKRLCS